MVNSSRGPAWPWDEVRDRLGIPAGLRKTMPEDEEEPQDQEDERGLDEHGESPEERRTARLPGQYIHPPPDGQRLKERRLEVAIGRTLR